MAIFKHKSFLYIIIGAAELFTWIPLAMFAAFLIFGPYIQIHLNLNPLSSLIFNALLSFAFFFQHSLMIRKSVHIWLENYIPFQFHRSLFATLSGTFLLLVIILWQPTQYYVIELQGSFRWLCRAIFLLSIGGFIWAGQMLENLDTSGAKSIKQYMNKDLAEKPSRSSAFIITGPYGWVRHPLYFFTFLMIWSFPDISADRLLFNLLWTGWIIVGAFMEEKDLIKTFGDAYRQYQQQVPMLMPNPFKKNFTHNT